MSGPMFQGSIPALITPFTNGSFDEQPVTLGKRNDNFVVVEEGLEEGDRVALRDPNMDGNPLLGQFSIIP